MNNTYNSTIPDYSENDNEIFWGKAESDDGHTVNITRNDEDLKDIVDQVMPKINLACIMQKHPAGMQTLCLRTSLEEDDSLAIPHDGSVQTIANQFAEKDLVFYNIYKPTSYLSLLISGESRLFADKIELMANNTGMLATIKDALQAQYDFNASQITFNTEQIAYNALLIPVLQSLGASPAQTTPLTNKNATLTADNATLTSKNADLLAKINILSPLIA